MFEKIVRPIREQLLQGAHPRGLALTIAMGVALALFPILGMTTALCVIVGVRYKLNQPILQMINYLLYPVQILMIPVFIYFGSSLFGNPISIRPQVVMSVLSTNPSLFLKHYGLAGLQGVLVWCVFAPIIGTGFYYLSYFLFSRNRVNP